MRTEKEIKEEIKQEQRIMYKENEICKKLKRPCYNQPHLIKIDTLKWVLGA